MWALIGKVWTVVAAIVAFAAGCNSLTSQPETPDLNDAQLFLTWYYVTAPRDPGATWARTTKAYKMAQAGRTEGTVTFPVYALWYSKMDYIAVDHIGTDPRRGPNWFRMRLTYYEKRVPRPKGPERVAFELVCPSRTRFFWSSCSADNVMINATRYE